MNHQNSAGGVELVMADLIWEAVRECEIHCVAACCGEDAFELDPQQMRIRVASWPPERIVDVLFEIDRLIVELNRMGPNTSLKWFSHNAPNGPGPWLEDVRECVIEATTPPTTTTDGLPIVRRIVADVEVLTKRESLKNGFTQVLLPDRPLRTAIELAVSPLGSGSTSRANLRFLLPRRAQPFCKVGGTLFLAHFMSEKVAAATILTLQSDG